MRAELGLLAAPASGGKSDAVLVSACLSLSVCVEVSLQRDNCALIKRRVQMLISQLMLAALFFGNKTERHRCQPAALRPRIRSNQYYRFVFHRLLFPPEGWDETGNVPVQPADPGRMDVYFGKGGGD